MRGIKGKTYEKHSLDMQLLEIRVPHKNEVEINAMDQLFASLYGLSYGGKGIKRLFKASDFISFEIIAFPETIRFYVCVSKNIRTMVEKQIHASYPSADIKDVEEYKTPPCVRYWAHGHG